MRNRPLLIALAATAGAISLAACETDTYGGASTSDTAATPSARPDNSGVNAGASSSRSSTAARVPSSEDPPAPTAQ